MVDRLAEFNFQMWKQIIKLALAYCEVDDVVEEQIPHVVATVEY